MHRSKPSGRSGVLQTHCKQGHTFSVENTIIRKNGQRLCRTCRNNNGKKWANQNLDYSSAGSRRRHLKAQYNMTLEEWDKVWKSQGGMCAICKKELVVGKAHTDHCHKTGRVRGLLCRFCNVGIGNLRDSKEILQAAIDYLDKSAGVGLDNEKQM